MALDQIQYAAVRHFNGPAMILAGPGSGKTTVITHRIWSLIKDRGVCQDKILVITFTKMAAVEMKNRFLKMGNLSSTGVNFGTFHAIFFMILKSVYGFKATDIVKVSQQWKFIKTQFSLYNVEIRDENNTIGDIISEIGKVKSLDDNARAGYIPKSCEYKLFFNIFDEYERWLKLSHMVDFEDMMIKTYELFSNDKDELKKWQDRFGYILIDEFQDASPMQFKIVKMLAEGHNNIFVVGDDDQSIYGFRGAAPAVMQEFKNSYEDISVYTLNVNYRSNEAVVESATKLININKDRFYKNLKAFHDRGCEVEKLEFDTIVEENSYVAHIAQDGIMTAILTRTNSGAYDIKRYLEHDGIGVDIKDADKGDKLFSHWIALDIASYIRIACGSTKRADYVRIINKPVRFISREFFISESVDTDVILMRMKQGRQIKLHDNFLRLIIDMQVLKSMTPYAGINYIRKKFGYYSYISEYSHEHGECRDNLIKLLDRLQESAAGYDSYNEWLKLYNYDNKKTDNVQLNNTRSQGLSKDTDKQHNNVTICTMHSSKGLEYDRVIIIDANEGIMPYNKAVTKADIEEERRLFYVAMTRAKKQLIICSVRERYNKCLLPSRFLKEF